MDLNRRTIFFGDVQEYLGVLAKRYDNDAWLLNQSNQHLFLQDHNQNITVYTSLGDLSKDFGRVYELLSSADRIFYHPPAIWSDGKKYDVTDPTASIQGLSETLLLLLPDSVQVNGLDCSATVAHDPIPLVDMRKTDQPQIWIAGCSISHGIGIHPNKRYGILLAEELGMCCSFLTRPGSALNWAADQICRSDIRNGDLVIWGLTGWERLTYVHEHQLLQGVNINSYTGYPHYQDIVSMDNLFSQQTFYDHLYSVQRVSNFCEKVGAQLALTALFGNYALLPFLKSQKNYLHIDYKFDYQNSALSTKYLDVGTDSIHPGPQQHQAYKNAILDFIQKNLQYTN